MRASYTPRQMNEPTEVVWRCRAALWTEAEQQLSVLRLTRPVISPRGASIQAALPTFNNLSLCLPYPDQGGQGNTSKPPSPKELRSVVGLSMFSHGEQHTGLTRCWTGLSVFDLNSCTWEHSASLQRRAASQWKHHQSAQRKCGVDQCKNITVHYSVCSCRLLVSLHGARSRFSFSSLNRRSVVFWGIYELFTYCCVTSMFYFKKV